MKDLLSVGWSPRNTHTKMDAGPLLVNLECLKYAHENGCPWDERICSSVAWKWSPRVFEIRARKRVSLGMEELVVLMVENLECLRYAHENGCPWNRWT